MADINDYLKPGQSPLERIEQDHGDILALMGLLEKEKRKNEWLLIAEHAPPSDGFFVVWSDLYPEIESCVRADIYWGAIERERARGQPLHLSFSHWTHWKPTSRP